ncbi:MAG: UDP-N-acetylmuramoyl-L-alanine--D-glutamate ligase [Acidobacteriaceae bacterium]
MELKNKRVLVVGLGRSGLAAAMFLRSQGACVTVSDIRSADLLAREIPSLLDAGIMVETGGHGLFTFRRQDLIVVSPGVPLDTPELKQARSFGLPIIGELELAAQHLHGSILAVTGSNGKTTTTTLLGKILTEGGLPTQVGGNIGLPVVDLIASSAPETWNVLEVSSFQLETIDEFHPRIAAILNITPDHLDRHGSLENYIAAKEKIFANQTPDDLLVLNADDDAAQRCAARARSSIYWFSGKRPVRQGAFVHQGVVVFVPSEGAAMEPVLPVASIPLKGAHNVENILAAVCAARLAGVAADSIRQSIESFSAVEHRLEFVASVNGADYYNDSKATNVDAAMKAIASFPHGVHLILGGKDKNSDYTLLAPLLRQRVKSVYTIGSAAQKIEHQLAGVVKMVAAGTLDQAVRCASEAAQPGETVLLAPACSSFDQFENYEQRGRTFKELVLALPPA